MVLISNHAKAIVWFYLMTDRGAFLSTASDIKLSLIDLHKVLVRLTEQILSSVKHISEM